MGVFTFPLNRLGSVPSAVEATYLSANKIKKAPPDLAA